MNSENKLSLLIKVMSRDTISLSLIGIGIAKLQVNLDILPDSLHFSYSG